jgi:hypothetical protein
MEISRCPECGAPHTGGLTCRSAFDEFLALELTDPEYGSVHLLTVACYMIQHGQYTDEALAWIERRLRDHLEGGIPAETIRREAAGETDQGKRDWKVTRRPGDPPQPKIQWSMTIMDVARDHRDAESYRELVKEWARRTLQEMKPLLRET